MYIRAYVRSSNDGKRIKHRPERLALVLLVLTVASTLPYSVAVNPRACYGWRARERANRDPTPEFFSIY